MSIEMWTDPNNPLNRYAIGTEGWQFNDSGRPNNILDDARDSILAAIRTLFPGIGYIPSVLVGWIAGDGAYCPTYGLWAGPGWASGVRFPSEENDQINWGSEPCFNENVKTAGNPENCYTLLSQVFLTWITINKDKPSSPKDSTELGIEPAKGRIKISTLSCRT